MIENIKILQTELNIQFSDKVEDNFPLIWLRDHAKDELNWDERSNQRKTFTALIDSNLKIKEASILENGKSLSILWSDLNSTIKYSHDFLRKNILSQKTNSSNLKFQNLSLKAPISSKDSIKLKRDASLKTNSPIIEKPTTSCPFPFISSTS